MKRLASALITLVLLAAVLWLTRWQPLASVPASAATPQQCIERMFAAAARGDVETYAGCFSGSQRARLERELLDLSRDQFARQLSQATRRLKGRSMYQINGAPPPYAQSARATFAVERIYTTTMERQVYHLTRHSNVWRISAVEPARPYQPIQPYGSPVFQLSESTKAE